MSFVEIGLESQTLSLIRQIKNKNNELTIESAKPFSRICDSGCKSNILENIRNQIDNLQERLNTVQDEIIFTETPSQQETDNTLRNALIIGGVLLLLL